MAECTNNTAKQKNFTTRMTACLLYYTSSHILHAHLKAEEMSFSGDDSVLSYIASGKIPLHTVFCCEDFHVPKSSSNVQLLQLFEQTNCLTFHITF